VCGRTGGGIKGGVGWGKKGKRTVRGSMVWLMVQKRNSGKKGRNQKGNEAKSRGEFNMGTEEKGQGLTIEEPRQSPAGKEGRENGDKGQQRKERDKSQGRQPS